MLEASARRKSLDWDPNTNRRRTYGRQVDFKLTCDTNCEYFVIEAARFSTHEKFGFKHDADHEKLARHLNDMICVLEEKLGTQAVCSSTNFKEIS